MYTDGAILADNPLECKMTWIHTVPYANATGKLKTLYDRIKGPDSNVDNIMIAHSLRPHTMEGHLALYKNVLHHSANKIPKWFMECLGIRVSIMNGCDYCASHHFEGMQRLLKNDEQAQTIHRALREGGIERVFNERELAAIRYAERLTSDPAILNEGDIEMLRKVGYDDGEILEINQIVSYFAYANRMVLGIGVNTDGDILGLSPSSEDADNLSHR